MNRPDTPSLRDHCAPDSETQDEQEERGAIVGDVQLALRQMGPWATSFFMHLALVVLALMLVFIMVPDVPEEDFIPKAAMTPSVSKMVSTATNPLTTDAKPINRRVINNTTPTVDPIDKITKATSSQSKLTNLGVSGGAAGGLGLPVIASGPGHKGMLDLPPGGPSGEQAKKIIYVLDASGSMVDSLPFVLKEMNQSISRLSSDQQFNAVFFVDGTAVEIPVPNLGWKRADAEAKLAVANWANSDVRSIVPQGRTDPIQAIRLAMKYQPEAIILLSDNITGRGRYELNHAELMGLLIKEDPKNHVVIHTVQFLSEDPSRALEQIASAHHGTHKFVTEADLGLARH